MTTAALQLPVNDYDPGVHDFQERVHQTIKHDLAPLGEVVEISGEIVSTRRNGVLFTGVDVLVEHPRFRVPIGLKVTWNEDLARPSYWTNDGEEFTPTPSNGYSEGSRDQELIRAILARLESHPALTTDSPDLDAAEREAVLGYMSTVGAVTTTCLLMAMTSLPDLALVLGGGAASGGAVLVGARGVLSGRRRREAHRQILESWNRDLRGTLMESISGRVEESAFLDALHTAAKQHEITDISNIQAGTLSGLSWKSTDRCELVTGKAVEYMRHHDILRSPMITLTGERKKTPQISIFYWDGMHFYAKSNNYDQWVTPIPSAVKTQKKAQAESNRLGDSTAETVMRSRIGKMLRREKSC